MDKDDFAFSLEVDSECCSLTWRQNSKTGDVSGELPEKPLIAWFVCFQYASQEIFKKSYFKFKFQHIVLP